MYIFSLLSLLCFHHFVIILLFKPSVLKFFFLHFLTFFVTNQIVAMRTLILISWFLLALLNFSIIREASSACTTSPTANEMVITSYNSYPCTGGVSSRITIPNKVCTLVPAFSSQYVLVDCATGSYNYYYDSKCTQTVYSTPSCQNICDSASNTGQCKYVK